MRTVETQSSTPPSRIENPVMPRRTFLTFLVAAFHGRLLEGAETGKIEAVLRHPTATIQELRELPAGDSGVVLVTDPNGIPRVETGRHIEAKGKAAFWRQERPARLHVIDEEDPNHDIECAGLPIMTEDGHEFILTSWHGTAELDNGFYELMTGDGIDCVSALPCEIVTRCPGDQFPLPSTRIDPSLNSEDLLQKMLSVVVTGKSKPLRITGKPIEFNEDSEEHPKSHGVKSLALVIDTQDPAAPDPREIRWMIGSPVTAEGSKHAVGILVRAFLVPEQHRMCLLLSTPEHLRLTVAAAEENRAGDVEEYDLPELVRLASQQ